MTDWSPDRYLAFADERTRPARDLLAQVPILAPRRVVDVGCGPGNSTELLVQRWPDADVTGLDTSPAMLEAARRRLPTVRFVEADVERWAAEGPVDVIFANAVLQWTADPIATMERLIGQLAPGGVLAVQMPDNTAEPSHRLMEEIAQAGTWAERLKGAGRPPLPPAETFYDRLSGVVERLEIWHTIYQHRLDGPAAVVAWVMTTGLKPYLDRLEEPARSQFIGRYSEALAQAYPERADGKVLFRFPRLFVVAIGRRA